MLAPFQSIDRTLTQGIIVNTQEEASVKIEAFSSKHRSIIYSSIRPEETGLYKINLEGKSEQILSSNNFHAHPVPSPDGKFIIYSGISHGVQSLYINDHVNQREWKLTNGTCFEDNAVFDSMGNLYFCSNHEGNMHIYRTQFIPEGIDIFSAEKITNGSGNDFSFSLSPCSNYLVYSSNRDNQEAFDGAQPRITYQSGQLYLMDIKKKQPSLLTGQEKVKGGTPWEGTPIWSSCGRYIFYYSTAGSEKHHPQLCRYNIATKQVGTLTEKESKALSPEICGDKMFISYQKEPTKRWKIKFINLKEELNRGDHDPILPKLEKLATASKRQFWSLKNIVGGSLIAVGTVREKTASTTPFPPYRSLPNGEGNFCIDEGNVNGIKFTAVRRYFPVFLDKQTVATIDAEFQKVILSALDGSNESVLYNSPKGLYGLSADSNGNIVATEGAPFRAGERHIVLLNRNEQINLTEKYGKGVVNEWPSITPDGRYVAFDRQIEKERKQLFLLDRIENVLHQITHEKDRDNLMPSISEDGRTIIYSFHFKSVVLSCVKALAVKRSKVGPYY